MSIRGTIIAKVPGSTIPFTMPFVGRNPDRALTDFMKKGFARARFEAHKPEGGDDVA